MGIDDEGVTPQELAKLVGELDAAIERVLDELSPEVVQLRLDLVLWDVYGPDWV